MTDVKPLFISEEAMATLLTRNQTLVCDGCQADANEHDCLGTDALFKGDPIYYTFFTSDKEGPFPIDPATLEKRHKQGLTVEIQFRLPCQCFDCNYSNLEWDVLNSLRTERMELIRGRDPDFGGAM